MPMKERHVSDAALAKAEDVFIVGERLDKPSTPAPASNKLTDWFTTSREATPAPTVCYLDTGILRY